MGRFTKICRKTQVELKDYAEEFLKTHGYKVTVGDGYLYGEAKTNSKAVTPPVLLTAHMDTVHKENVKSVVYENGGNKISSPQGIGGDDRCGVWIITEIISKTELRPPVLLCEDEEIGGVGSRKFLKDKNAKLIRRKLSEMKFFIELDRANAKDAVFYDCDNPEFTEWILSETDLKESWGTYSDISELCPELGVAGVNISCGYYEAHTTKEYVLVNEMKAAANTTIHLLEAATAENVPAFEFIEAVYTYKGMWSGIYSNNYGYSELGGGTTRSITGNPFFGGVWISWFDRMEGTDFEDYMEGKSMDEAFGKFFRTYPNVCWNDILDYEFY